MLRVLTLLLFNAITFAAAAQMASELWRVNGWCVTGTVHTQTQTCSDTLHPTLFPSHTYTLDQPLTKSIEDLHGLLVFLDHDPFADKNSLIRLMLRPYRLGLPEDVVAVRTCFLKPA
jgi:hypothetical protein